MDNSIADSQPPSIRRKDDEDLPWCAIRPWAEAEEHEHTAWQPSEGKLELELEVTPRGSTAVEFKTLYPNRSFSGP